MLSAETLYQRGVAASSAGRFGAARRYLGLAAERATETDLAALITISRAYVEAETSDPREALRLCEEALVRNGISARTRAVAVSQRGLLRARLGDTTGALRDLTDALSEIGEDPVLAGRAHLNRGALRLQIGDAGLARQDFEAARTVLGSPDVDANYDKAGFNLGYVHLLRGELVTALRLMDEVSPRLSRLGPVYRATIQQDRSEVLIAAGMAGEGEQALAEAARAYGQRRLRQYQAEAELVRARTLLHRNPRLARTVAQQAGRRFRARGSEVWGLRAAAVGLMATVAGGGRAAALVEEADELVPALRRERLMADAALVELYATRVLIRRGQVADASRRLRRFRPGVDGPIATRLMWHEVRGDLARARGRRTRSLAHARAGLAELQTWQSSFGSLDLQSGLVGHGRQLAVDGLRVAVADGSPDLVFEWSERARMLVSRVVPVRAPTDERVAAELAELRWLQGQQPAPRSREARRVAELRETIRHHAWYGSGTGEVTEPCTLAELQAALGDGSALVAYVATEDEVVALLVTDETATVHALGGREPLDSILGGLHPDLDMAGSDLPPAFAGVVRGELAVRLDRLSTLLVDPLRGELADRRVVLTPSGILAGVPWGLLPGLAGRPVTVTRSATSWLGRQDRPLRLGSAGFVAGPRVARAEAEVLAAAAVWPRSEALRGELATSSAVSDLAARVDVLHVSAHGRHSAENPMFSGLELVDGPWFGYDIDQLPEVPDVVLLSACEVGRSQVRYGDELIGMTTAWLHAGVRCVVASAAAVHDDVAHDVLIGVHRGLGAGLDPAEALAAALPAASEGAPPAPFVCFG